jgi:hypothetical protein
MDFRFLNVSAHQQDPQKAPTCIKPRCHYAFLCDARFDCYMRLREKINKKQNVKRKSHEVVSFHVCMGKHSVRDSDKKNIKRINQSPSVSHVRGGEPPPPYPTNGDGSKKKHLLGSQM